MWKEGGKEDIFTQQGHDDDDEEKRNATRIKKKGEDGAKFPINNGGCVARMRDMPAAALRRTHGARSNGLLTQLAHVPARDARKGMQ